ncbi:hypothetical protein ACO0RG_002979 [Hanseniaspora osmophila]
MNNSDTTSFKSILENAKKFQQLKNSNEHVEQQTRNTTPPANKAGHIVNSFNRTGERTEQSGSSTYASKSSFQKPQFKSSESKTILVNKSQKGNPLLDKFANVNWRYVSSSSSLLEKIDYDYMVRGKRKVIFLSLKYHKLHPEYIVKKLKPVANQGAIMLCVVDIEKSENILKDLNKLCLFNGFTLLLSFNFEQAAKYLMYMNSS